MVDKDNDPQVEDFEKPPFFENSKHQAAYEAERDGNPVERDFELWETVPYINPDLVKDFESSEVISLDLERGLEVSTVIAALHQTSILSNVVFGPAASRILARLDNELGG